MCKIKSTLGKELRAGGVTAFEIDAVKFAVNGNIAPGTMFDWKTERPGFMVMKNDGVQISLKRMSTGRIITFDIISDVKPAKAEKPTPAAAEAVTPVTPAAPAAGVTSGNNMDVNAALQVLMNAVNKPQTANIDAKQVSEMVNEIVDDKITDILLAHQTRITVNGVEITSMQGQTLHPCFEDVLTAVTDNEIPYLYGPAGTGKTYLAEQVAKAMQLPFYAVGGLQNKYELEGFKDASGVYQETPLYQAMKNGGVFLLDEIDSTAAEVLVPFNSIMANNYYTFPNGERVTACKDFHIICAGNTTGRGADSAYNGRFQLDASTLDRFGFISVPYCEKIELAKCNDDYELLEFCHALRDQVEKQGLTYTVTPRAMERISKKVLHGWTLEKSLSYGLCGGWDKQDVKLLQSNISLSTSNKWVKAFKK